MNQSPSFSLGTPRRFALVWSAILILAAAFAPAARGAVKIWSGGASPNGNWSAGVNWGGSAPNAGDDLIFNNVTLGLRNTNDFPAGRGFSSITFLGSNYIVQGNAILLTNGLSSQQPNFSNTFNPPITLNAPQTLECTTVGATLILGSNLVMSAGATNIILNAVGRMEEAGAISGNGTVTKNGGGTNLYRGPLSNTYTNLTSINGGTLELSKAGAPFATAIAGDVVVGNGSVASTLRNLNALEIADTADVRINRFSTWDLNDHSETISNLTLVGGTVDTGTGVLTPLGDIDVLSALSTSFINGFLNLGPVNQNIDVASGSAPALTINAVISGNPGVGFTKTGSGQLRLAGANTYTGPTVLSGFVLLANDLALGASGQTTNGTVLNASGFLLVAGANIPDEFLTLNLNDDLRSSGTAGWAGPITLNGNVFINVFGGTFTNSGVISGPGGLTKGQSGTLIFSGPSGNTYLGDTVVNTGILQLSKNPNLFAVRGSSLVIGDDIGGDGVDIVRYTANGQLLSTVPITINSSGLLDLNNFTDDVGAITFSGGHVTTGAGTLQLNGNVTANTNVNNFARIDGNMLMNGTRTFDVAEGAFSPDLRITAAVRGAGGITKIGAGEMSLTVSNTYTGLTTVSSGFLRLENDWALGSTNTGTVVAGGAILALLFDTHVGLEPLTLNGPGGFGIFGALSGSFGSNSWDGVITLGSSATVSVIGNNDFLNLAGQITGAGDLKKIGPGTLILSGPAINDYTGSTFLNEGTNLLAKSVTDGAIPHNLFVGDGTGADLADVVRILDRPQIATVSDVTVATSGLLDVNGIGDGIGTLSGFGRVDLGSGSILINGNGDTTYRGLIIGAGGNLSKSGTGTFTLTANNTYSGSTVINNGTLVVNGSQPASAVTINANGTLAGSGRVGNITSSSGDVKPGTSPGVLTCGNVLFNAGTVLTAELNGPNPGLNGYDQLNVIGTVNLGSAALVVVPGPGFAPIEGDQLVILNNDAAEAITGTFSGKANGSVFTAGGLQFHIRYFDAFGNDVILTVTNTAARFVRAVVSGGNSNGAVDVNECDLLHVALTNVSGGALIGVTGTLVPKTPGVSVTLGTAAYPNIPLGGRGTNSTPFQFSTSPAFGCGTNLDFELVVSTAANGTFAIPFSIPSGFAGPALRFNQNTDLAIPDVGTVESSVLVAGLTTPLARVTVSMNITHTAVGDLALTLIGPDGTFIDLSSGNGGTGDDYGAGEADADRTTFTDGAGTAITSGAPNFRGAFRPEQPLATFEGKLGAAVNGTWRLRIADSAGGSLGTLRAWSIFLSPTACADGGGACESCPENAVLRGTLGAGSLVQTDRLTRDGNSSVCGVSKLCPGPLGDALPRHYDAYTFENCESNACISVTLQSDCALFSVAYLNSYDPANFCTSYLADMGDSTDNGVTNYSFNVPARSRFVVVVNEVSSLAGCGYTLRVTGGSCRPCLNIAKVPGNKVALDWSTSALGYLLEQSAVLRNPPPTLWVPVFDAPVITGSRFRVTNNIDGPPTNRFYQLRKP